MRHIFIITLMIALAVFALLTLVLVTEALSGGIYNERFLLFYDPLIMLFSAAILFILAQLERMKF